MDWGMSVIYSLEGDGPLVMEAYKKIETVRAAIHTRHTPNINAVARQFVW